ncbi:S-layer homology domain-containing protein [Cohnella suwonensis]|uniref:S-layer homology domain-containing protein n=1 Tax=Cohnella suwonensis TaxID=696072 RepID=A0ABW0LX30_9BACL
MNLKRVQWKRIGIFALSFVLLLGAIVVPSRGEADAAPGGVQAEVLSTYKFTSNATYDGYVAKYVYSDGTTVQEGTAVPASAKWATASSIYDGAWGRYSREAVYWYSDGEQVYEATDPLNIPANAIWATIYKYKINGMYIQNPSNDPFIGQQVFRYSLDGIHTLTGDSIPAYAVWGTFAGGTDGYGFHSHSETYVTYDRGSIPPAVAELSVESDNPASASWAKPGDTITVSIATDAPVDEVVATVAGQAAVAEQEDDTHWTATLILDGSAVDGELPVLVKLVANGELLSSANATTDGSKVAVDSTGPSTSISSDPNWMTNEDVTVTAEASDSGSGVVVIKWAAGERTAAYFAEAGQALTEEGFAVSENGTFTIYAKDRLGNESVETVGIYWIDKTSPTIAQAGTSSGALPVKVRVSLNGTGSEIVRSKWASGERDGSYFEDDGEWLMPVIEGCDAVDFEELEECIWDMDEDEFDWQSFDATFTAAEYGMHTVYVEDEAGNGSLLTISVNPPAQTGGPGPASPVPASPVPASPVPVSGPATVTGTDGRLTLPSGQIGQASLEDDIAITIPSNATDKELRLTIDKLADATGLLPHGEKLASPIYEFLKSFPENFLKPITMTFRFDPSSLSGNEAPAVFYFDETKKEWIRIVGGRIGGDRITVETDHFTKYAVLAVDPATGLPAVKEPAIPTEPLKDIRFGDIGGHWAESDIIKAASAGIVNGYADGTFMPGKTVTRAEFAVMLANALKPAATGTAPAFADSTAIPSWARQAVALAAQAGIVTGDQSGRFRPNAPITRAEMAVMLANSLKLKLDLGAVTGFADDKDIPSWAKGAVAAAKESGLMQGKGAGAFAPAGVTTRAEAVTALMKALAYSNK